MKSKGRDQNIDRYRFLAECMPQIVWTATPDGSLDYYNQRWFDYSGTDFEKMEALGWTSFVHPEDLPNAVAVWQRALDAKDGYEVEFRLKRASDGTFRWHLARAFPMKTDQGEVLQWVGTCTDINDQLMAKELLEQTVIERTAKIQGLMEGMEAFSYEISHDLRAPLRALTGFSKILIEDHSSKLDDEGKDYLDRIHAASHRMDELIQNVLNFSLTGRDELLLEPVYPLPLIKEITETYPHLDDSLIIVSLGPLIPPVLANEAALGQCVSNILSNAVKFVAEGVRPHVTVSSTIISGRVRICFKDNGIGIASENHERIFGIFQRVDQRHEGTGIGLSLVRRTVERMGGLVGLESTLGEGTTFWLEFPLSATTESQDEMLLGENQKPTISGFAGNASKEVRLHEAEKIRQEYIKSMDTSARFDE